MRVIGRGRQTARPAARAWKDAGVGRAGQTHWPVERGRETLALGRCETNTYVRTRPVVRAH